MGFFALPHPAPMPARARGPRLAHIVAVAPSFYEFATGASQTRMGCPYSRDSVRD